MPPMPPSSEELAALRDRAEKFATSPRTVAAVHAALADPEIIRGAINDPIGFFKEHGVRVPPSFDIEISDRELRTLPGPDWFPFVLEFFNCRTYYVRVCDDQAPPLCKWREESVCFGFRVYPRGIPKIG
ncbi:MAG TPA: hypothetical protein VLD86_18185 [Ilumatobacteraceae bacterium]|nr:hypothetical protein [Ilumatobacteraceae bacterium]